MRILILLLFVGSGAAALVYEVVWQQLLQLVIGSSTVSLGLLPATFMGGMCLGSVLAPRLVPGALHPLRAYACLEAAIGAIGLLLLWTIPLVARIYAAWGGGAGGLLVRCAVAVLCLLPPTCAMGATLPAISRWVAPTRAGVSWLGWFYAGNIAGAVAGCLAAGFYLLRVYDMTVATWVAASLNGLVAAGAWMLAHRRPDASPVVEAEEAAIDDSDAPAPDISPVRVYVVIALSGFCAVAAEVVWTRLLALLFSATVYAFSIILAVFLIGLGIGSGAGAALSRRIAPARALA